MWRLHGNRVSKTQFTFKKKTKKKPQGQHQRVHQRRKKKKKEKETQETVAQRPGFAARPGSTRAAYVAGLDLARPGSAWADLHFFFFFFSFFFFFPFFLRFLPLFLHFGLHFGSLIFYFWVRNRILETRFPCRRHLEKVPHKRRTTHENQASI